MAICVIIGAVLLLAFSSEATPLSKTNSASGRLSSSFREENTIVEQTQMRSKEVVAPDPEIGTTTSLFSATKTQSLAEVRIEQSSSTNTETKTIESNVINETTANYHDNEETQIDATSKPIITTERNSLFSVASIFRLLAKALRAAPFFG
ncbi:uncharacterized protein LOC129567808 [Sitodiplosis mosellana]|uniref:uncharacterized protein LOC129567808 n=1 Tax=Sitodiplosis mosellana TaxID=263140 RepID=UPI002443C214|nr:uncharacterized protein LOC129567808 [Sitodiplosis mosellana]